jgi:hypothetical protein
MFRLGLAVAATLSAALLPSMGRNLAVSSSSSSRSSLLVEGAKFPAHLLRVAVMAIMTSSHPATALDRQVAREA